MKTPYYLFAANDLLLESGSGTAGDRTVRSITFQEHYLSGALHTVRSITYCQEYYLFPANALLLDSASGIGGDRTVRRFLLGLRGGGDNPGPGPGGKDGANPGTCG